MPTNLLILAAIKTPMIILRTPPSVVPKGVFLSVLFTKSVDFKISTTTDRQAINSLPPKP
jgi:hypothetical protein